ncbi:hypothetical protein DBT36_03780 [Aerococcus mictus]|nr:hypothetical protein DBT51_01760 [Aerococcus loyolae]RAV71877.1 hypothetical protein DBT47_04115 [Aerococcus mictus]RAV85629.1 hypothetical protein DBT36_03780 [Aerococcus mictus]RAV92353.1 hypothetical protein DBT45_04420 [Aerococcus tenax]RAV96320.1 hypothetical protein DBT46_03780 [Aerococcus mictus]
MLACYRSIHFTNSLTTKYIRIFSKTKVRKTGQKSPEPLKRTKIDSENYLLLFVKWWSGLTIKAHIYLTRDLDKITNDLN